MSTDDHPTDPGGYPGVYSSGGGAGYSGAHRLGEPEDSGYGNLDTGGYDSSTTTVLSRPTEPAADDEPARRGYTWHGGMDVGLLVLRLAIGGTFVAHSLQKLFGLWGGLGIDGFARYLGTFGFSQTTLLSWITGIGELVGGALLVLGLFTPVGAAAVLAVAANVIYLKWSGGFFDPPVGFEREALLASGAFILLFTGPGRVSLDRPTPWGRRPVPLGLFMLLVAAGLCVLTLIVLR
ncbi:DoxX family protein [Actinocrispum wychmicini]|uniref:Putative oxidoreductase n=1 Tax=Actinocrispum wychmicini TaxID=1213861 RepID=A0A4R2JKI8_9PSEU|nr:DoxX family protein [Actinocrispum wychmicini]TCO57069.1 putative oxidoreductase [Actinocrispum wychmicini]